MLAVISSNNAKELKFYCRKVESTRNGKLRRLTLRFQTLLWRLGDYTVQNLESSGLSGRVDSTAYSVHELNPYFSHDNIP